MGCAVARTLQSVTVTTSPTPAVPLDSHSAVPAHVLHPQRIRSYVLRAGRTTSGQANALADLGPRFVLPFAQSGAALALVYPQLASMAGALPAQTTTRPLVLEIGFGMGEATAQIAALQPDTDFLCCEVHPPGVGALLRRIEAQGLTNIRIVAHDAVEVMACMLPEWSALHPLAGLDGVHVFFPDPWHKKRHNKRRLIQPELVASLAARLKPGAYLHCATDWQPYAEHMLQVLTAEPRLHNRFASTHPQLGGFAVQPAYRPLTKFEKRGLGLGHGVWDLVFHRRAA